MSRRSTSKHEMAVFRRVHGLTQAELGQVLGVGRRTIQAIELGQITFPEKHRLKLARIEGKDLISVIERRAADHRRHLYKQAGIAAPAN